MMGLIPLALGFVLGVVVGLVVKFGFTVQPRVDVGQMFTGGSTLVVGLLVGFLFNRIQGRKQQEKQLLIQLCTSALDRLRAVEDHFDSLLKCGTGWAAEDVGCRMLFLLSRYSNAVHSIGEALAKVPGAENVAGMKTALEEVVLLRQISEPMTVQELPTPKMVCARVKMCRDTLHGVMISVARL